MTPLCFVDTETTGVHPGRQPWEIALIRRDDTNPALEMSFFVEVDLSVADPFGLKVGRFHERHPMGRYLAGHGVEEPEIYDEGDEYFSGREAALQVARYTHGAHLVGAVPNFDAEVFDELLRLNNLIPAWHYHLIDVEALAVGWLTAAARFERGPRVELGLPWKSDDLSLAVGVEPTPDEERHTALGDARWAMRLYDAITGGAK